MEAYEYVFTSLRGRQAGRQFFITMCPLKLVPKLFLFQEEELPAELRAQRVLNKARIPEIAQYMISNKGNYVFSSLTASIDGTVHFEPFTLEGTKLNDIGRLRIPMDARFLINDGQHRRAAIEEALKQAPDLGDEAISVVFFVDVGLKRSQQIFADLNKHAVRPTRSLGILYDHRDPLSVLAKRLVSKVETFKNLTEIEKTTISNRSIKLFTLSSIYQGTLSLLRKAPHSQDVSDKDEALAADYWNCVCDNMPDWKLAADKAISAFELRRDYVHAHALMVHAIGRLGADLLSTPNKDYKRELKRLKKIDWLRGNSAIWEGRAMIGGKISKSNDCVILTTNYLKTAVGLPLAPDELKVERVFLRK